MTTSTIITRAELLVEARKWVDTPFHHQGRVRGVGVDCIGLIVQPARDIGIPCVDGRAYSRQPNPTYTLSRLRQSFVEIATGDMLDGDVYYFDLTKSDAQQANGAALAHPHHFGYRTPTGILHAFDDALRESSSNRPRLGKTEETRLPVGWSAKVHSAWRFKYFAERGI